MQYDPVRKDCKRCSAVKKGHPKDCCLLFKTHSFHKDVDKCVLNSSVTKVLENIADEIKTGEKLSKVRFNLSRVPCGEAGRVYEGRKCTIKCLSARTDRFEANWNRCLTKKSLRAEAKLVITGGHLNENCADGVWNTREKKCECGAGYKVNADTGACEQIEVVSENEEEIRTVVVKETNGCYDTEQWN